MVAYMATRSLAVLYPLLSAVLFNIVLHTRDQTRRFWFLLPLIVFPIMSLDSARDLGLPISIRTLWTHGVLLYILHTTSLLFIEQYPAPMNSSNDLEGWRLWHWILSTSWWLATNFRMIESSDRKSKKDGRTRIPVSFLFLQAVKPPVYYYLQVHLIPTITEELLGIIGPNDLNVEKRRLFYGFANMTPRDFVIRAYFSVYWMWESFVWLDSLYSVAAFISVASTVHRPEDWPPLFGLSLQATNLRRFWSRFWHKLLARSGTNYGHVVAARVLGLRPGSDAYNVAVAFVIYGLSGLVHSIVAWKHRVKDSQLDIWWFLMNFACGLIEKKLLQCTRYLAKRTGLQQELRGIEQSWFGYLVGYSWIFSFFFCSVPFWKYPRLEQHALKVEKWTKYTSRLREIKANRGASSELSPGP